jgi:hypothetical protein
VAFFNLFLSLEASNANQCLPLESTEGRVVRSSIALAQPLRDPSNTSFKNLPYDAPKDSGLSRNALNLMFQNASASASVNLRTSICSLLYTFD